MPPKNKAAAVGPSEEELFNAHSEVFGAGGDPFGEDAPFDGEPELDIDLDRPNPDYLLPEGPAPFVVKALRLSEQVGPSGYHYIIPQYSCVLEGDAANFALWENLSLSPQARFRIDAFLDAIKAPRKGKITSMQQLSELAVGRQLWIDVIHEIFDGKTKARVGGYLVGPPVERREAVRPKDVATAPVQAKLGKEFD